MSPGSGRLPALSAGTLGSLVARTLLAAAALTAACAASAACETHVDPVMLVVENDSLTGQREDGGYTSGVRIEGFGATAAAPAVLDEFVERLAGSGLDTRCLPAQRQGGGQRSMFLLQEIHTPRMIELTGPQPGERPWAGYLALGRGWDVVGISDGTLVARRLELSLAVVGDASFARQSQELVHEVIDAAKPRGWDNQLRNRIGVELSYLERRRWGSERADLIGHAGATLGTIRSHALLGATARIGDVGCSMTTPGVLAHPIAIGGTLGAAACGSARHRPHVFAFAGADLRRVLRNELIEGEPRIGRSDVSAEPWVGDIRLGLAYGGTWWSISYTLIRRSNDLAGPPGTPSAVATFAGAVLTVDW